MVKRISRKPKTKFRQRLSRIIVLPVPTALSTGAATFIGSATGICFSIDRSHKKKPRPERLKAGHQMPGEPISLDREGAFDFIIRAGFLARGSVY
jgi:hypothetical protein